jgi:glucokinase
LGEGNGSTTADGRASAPSRVVLGLDFGGTKIAVAVCELSGERLASTTVAIDLEGDDPGEVANLNLQKGIALARALLDRAAPGAELAAVGACTFGIPTAKRIHLAPAIPGWGDLALEVELAAAFPGSEIRVANDVKAAAAAEARWGALVGCDPAIYVNLGTGLAIAIVTGGHVVFGAHGAAGEIAYNLRTLDDLEVPAGERVLLEEVVSGRALGQRATRLGDRPLTAADVLETVDEDDGHTLVLEEFLWELCFHLVNLAIALDPARIAVGGGMVGSWKRFEPRIRASLEAGVPFPPELVLGRFPFDAPLVGAAALASEAAGAVGAVEPGSSDRTGAGPGTAGAGDSIDSEGNISAQTGRQQ